MSKFFFAALIIATISCNSKTGNSFTVTGTIKNSNEKMVYLEQNLAGSERPLILDSAQIANNGSFRLSTTTKEEGLYSLRAGHAELPFAVLINDSKKITVNADLSSPGNAYSVSGSAASQELINFNHTMVESIKALLKYSDDYDSLSRVKTSDAATQKAIDSLQRMDSANYELTSAKMKDYVADIAEKNISPLLTVYAVTSFQQIAERRGIRGFTPTEVSVIVNKASTKFPDNTILQEWEKTLRPGKAPDFSLQDTSGKMVSLSSFKGKYVLVDFWASWCKPCRMENPNVVAAYNQYKDKNFTIVGVSLDTSHQAWMNAIHADGLAWNHVSDLKGWESETAAMYGVQSIPYNFLIGPDGNIVAEDVRGRELFSTLEKVLK